MLKKARKFAREKEFFGEITCNTEDSDLTYFKAFVRASMKPISREVKAALVKETGAMFMGYCPCKAGLAGYCSHIGALLFKVSAMKTVSCTSRLCSWTQPRNLSKSFAPRYLSDIPFVDPEKAEDAPQRPFPDVYSAGPCKDPDTFLSDIMAGLDLINPECVLFKTLSHSVESLDVFTNQFTPHFSFHDSVDLPAQCAVFEDFVTRLTVTHELIELIDMSTRGQSCNPDWNHIRTLILTASNFGSVIKRRESTLPDNLIARLRGYKLVPQTKAIAYGRNHESEARRHYVQQHAEKCGGNLDVRADSGLMVDAKHPFLGASLDGIVNCTECGKGAVEIKCPYSLRHTKLEDVSDSQFCSIIIDGVLKLKKTHNYYYQVMGQMGVTGLDWVDFFIWTPKGCSIERIAYDDHTWNEVMVPVLRKFYIHNFLPELYTDRVKRGKPLHRLDT